MNLLLILILKPKIKKVKFTTYKYKKGVLLPLIVEEYDQETGTQLIKRTKHQDNEDKIEKIIQYDPETGEVSQTINYEKDEIMIKNRTTP